MTRMALSSGSDPRRRAELLPEVTMSIARTRFIPNMLLRPATLLSLATAAGMVACAPDDSPTGPARGGPPDLAAVKTYTAVDLGVLPSSGPSVSGFSIAHDINDAGQVVGISSAEAGEIGHAFLWEKGTMTDLGTIGTGNFSEALGINAAGDVVGWSFILRESPQNETHAFRWRKGVMTDLGTLGGGYESPVGINPAGRVVAGGKLWDHGALIDLGTLGGCCTSANAINAAGQVVGRSYLSGSEDYHAFLWDRGVMTDLGTLGAGDSEALDINARGQVVGMSGNRAFVWETGVMTALAPLNDAYFSGAEAINAAGDIVGVSFNQQGTRATLWTRK